MIINNFIDHYTTDDNERDEMKDEAALYVDENWVDDIDSFMYKIKDLIATYKTKLVFVENIIISNFENQDSDIYRRMICKKECYQTIVTELEKILKS